MGAESAGRAAGLAAEDGATGASYVERVLAELPGAVFVIDGTGHIKLATGAAAEFVDCSPAELLGRSVLDFVSEESAWAYAAAVAMATDYTDVVTGPLRVSLKPAREGGLPRQADLWASSRLDDPSIDGIVCLLTPETTAVWLGEAVEAASTDASLVTIAEHVVTAMRGHPIVADAALLVPTPDGFEPLVPTTLDRGLIEGVEPWQATLATGMRQQTDVADLPADRRAAARAAGYEALWVEPVLAADETPIAVLTLWRRRAGGPSPNQLSSVHQAASILRLCWSRT